MKNTAVKILAAIMVCLFAAAFSACGAADEVPDDSGNVIAMSDAETIMIGYLKGKGFAEEDFLAEGKLMELDGVRVYAFSWRTKVGDNADRLFGTYAVSVDGGSFYEYQSDREVWIRDSAASAS